MVYCCSTLNTIPEPIKKERQKKNPVALKYTYFFTKLLFTVRSSDKFFVSNFFSCWICFFFEQFQ